MIAAQQRWSQVKRVAQSRDSNASLGGRLGSHYLVLSTHHFLHVSQLIHLTLIFQTRTSGSPETAMCCPAPTTWSTIRTAPLMLWCRERRSYFLKGTQLAHDKTRTRPQAAWLLTEDHLCPHQDGCCNGEFLGGREIFP